MSLIQEALKRQQEEKSAAKKAVPSASPAPKTDTQPPPQPPEIMPGISAIPPIPPAIKSKPGTQKKSTQPAASASRPSEPDETRESPAPEAGSAPIPVLQKVTTPKRNPRKIVIGVGMFLLIAVFFIFSKREEHDHGLASSVENTTTTETGEAPSQLQPEPATLNSGIKPVAPAVETVADTVTAPQPQPAVEVHVEPVAPAAEQVKDDVVTWPSLTLTSVMGKGTRGSALINGKLIGIGDDIEGAIFKSVGQNGIYLEYQGKTRFLKQGQTTY